MILGNKIMAIPVLI